MEINTQLLSRIDTLLTEANVTTTWRGKTRNFQNPPASDIPTFLHAGYIIRYGKVENYYGKPKISAALHICTVGSVPESAMAVYSVVLEKVFIFSKYRNWREWQRAEPAVASMGLWERLEANTGAVALALGARLFKMIEIAIIDAHFDGVAPKMAFEELKEGEANDK